MVQNQWSNFPSFSRVGNHETFRIEKSGIGHASTISRPLWKEDRKDRNFNHAHIFNERLSTHRVHLLRTLLDLEGALHNVRADHSQIRTRREWVERLGGYDDGLLSSISWVGNWDYSFEASKGYEVANLRRDVTRTDNLLWWEFEPRKGGNGKY